MDRILVAVSSAWAAEHIREPVGQLAHRMGTSLTLLHIRKRGASNEATDFARHLCESFVADGIECNDEVALDVEDVPGAILETAKRVGAMLIVIGIAGKSPFARTTGGDVPTELLKRTELPVLMLPPTSRIHF